MQRDAAVHQGDATPRLGHHDPDRHAVDHRPQHAGLRVELRRALLDGPPQRSVRGHDRDLVGEVAHQFAILRVRFEHESAAEDAHGLLARSQRCDEAVAPAQHLPDRLRALVVLRVDEDRFGRFERGAQ